VVTAVTLWLDQLYNGHIAIMASKSSLYQTMLTVVIIVRYHFFAPEASSYESLQLLIPWLLTACFIYIHFC
jgi:hypothetical protein